MSRDPRYTRLIVSKRWRELRRWKLTRTPLCERCEKAGRVTAAAEVHHVTPVETAPDLAGMERLMFDPANLASLCHKCHVETHRELKSHSRDTVRDRENAKLEDFRRKFL